MTRWQRGEAEIERLGDTPIPPGGTVYTGSGFAPLLSEVRPLEGAHYEVEFNPKGNVAMAEMTNDNWRFAAVPEPQCRLSGHCLRFKPLTISSPGAFLGWAP
jgi:hypothetical protein